MRFTSELDCLGQYVIIKAPVAKDVDCAYSLRLLPNLGGIV
jgi:hypothetical protein